MTTPHTGLLSQIRNRMPLARRYHIDACEINSVRDVNFAEDKSDLDEFVRLLENHCGAVFIGKFDTDPEPAFGSVHKTPVHLINIRPAAYPVLIKNGRRLLGGHSISKQEFAVEMECPTIEFALEQSKMCAKSIVKPGTSSFITVNDKTASPAKQRATRNNPRFYIHSSTYYWNSTVCRFKIYTCESKLGTKFNCPSQPWKHGRLVPVVRMEFVLKGGKNIRERLNISHPRLRFCDLFSRKAASWWELLAQNSLLVGHLNVELLRERITKSITKAGYVPSSEEVDRQFAMLMADEVVAGVPIDGFPQRLMQFLKGQPGEETDQKGRGRPSKADIIHKQVVADLRKFRNRAKSFLVLNTDGGRVCNQILDSARKAL